MWEPRVKLAGTYDEHWQKEQFPLLPKDFDVRYFQAAHPDLICRPHLQGNELVRIVGATPEGMIEFKLPSIAIGVAIHPSRGNPERQLALLDTVILRPDEHKLNLIWRSTILCPRKIFDIERVVAFVLRLKTAINMLQEFARYGLESTA
jgi:hypothetical protein